MQHAAPQMHLPTHPGLLVLEDERVKLTILTAADLNTLMPFALAEPDTWQYYVEDAAGTDGMHRFVDTALKQLTAGTALPFVVFDKQFNQVAGSTRLYNISPRNNSLMVGHTWYGHKFRGSGLNKHCKFLLLQYAFEVLNAHRAEFNAHAENKRSINAMQNIGCVFEGILRQHQLTFNGSYRDTAVLSILQPEWFSTIKPQLLAAL